MYPFDSDDEDKDEDEQRREEGYTRMTEIIEGVNTHPEQPGMIGKFWNGTTQIWTKYQKRRRALDRHTAETAKEAVSGILERRQQAQA